LRNGFRVCAMLCSLGTGIDRQKIEIQMQAR
jgi:hypothetical protein